MTNSLVSRDAAVEMLLLGSGWLTFGVAGLVWLREGSARRAIAHQLFIALFGIVGLMPTLLVLAMPLLWIFGPNSLVGAGLIAYFFAMLAYQLWKADSHFVDRWAANQQRTLQTLFNPTLGSIRIEPLQRQLQVQADLFLPFRSETLKALFSLGLILSMLIGFNLRKVYPEFSAFAWGIPALTFSTVCIQMAFLRFRLVLKILELEHRCGKKIVPMGDDEITKMRARHRKAKSR